jgi:hypothetical protein
MEGSVEDVYLKKSKSRFKQTENLNQFSVSEGFGFWDWGGFFRERRLWTKTKRAKSRQTLKPILIAV